MSKYLITILLLIFGGASFAQDADSLFAIKKGPKWMIKYTVRQGENAKMLAHRFFISDGVLSFANDDRNMGKINAGETIYLPVTRENYFMTRPSMTTADIEGLYYRVAPKDEIGVLCTYAGISKADLRAWNNLKGNTLIVDQVLFVGWVKMMDRDTSNPDNIAAYPLTKKETAVIIDTAVKNSVPGGLDSIYDKQTNGGLNVLSEKGTAVFFEKAGRNNIYYAFHNETPRGSIIKVYNPGSGKSIYVKVLGPIPDTKLYANCIIGISNGGRDALGISESKAWCELSYAAD